MVGSDSWSSHHLPVLAGSGILRSLRVIRSDTELGHLRFNLLHVDWIPRLPRRHGNDYVADSVDPLGSQQAHDTYRSLRFLSV